MIRALFLAVLVTLVAAILHEGGHALTAKGLGYDVSMSLNKVSPLTEPAETHAQLIRAGGPAVTLLIGLIGFVMALKGSRLGLTIVGTAFLYRLMAMIISLKNPNDEMRLSLDLGMGHWLLPGIVVGALLIMTIIGAFRARTGGLYLIMTWLGFTVALTAIVFSEDYLPSLQF